MKRSSQKRTSNAACSVPPKLVDFDKNSQPFCGSAWHTFDSLAPIGVKHRIIRTVDVNPEQGDTFGKFRIERGAMPAREEQATIGHDKRIHVVGQIEG